MTEAGRLPKTSQIADMIQEGQFLKLPCRVASWQCEKCGAVISTPDDTGVYIERVSNQS